MMVYLKMRKGKKREKECYAFLDETSNKEIETTLKGVINTYNKTLKPGERKKEYISYEIEKPNFTILTDYGIINKFIRLKKEQENILYRHIFDKIYGKHADNFLTLIENVKRYDDLLTIVKRIDFDLKIFIFEQLLEFILNSKKWENISEKAIIDRMEENLIIY